MREDDASRWERTKQLFDQARELSTERRRPFLVEACGGDTSLVADVERLLHHHDQASGFLESPAAPDVMLRRGVTSEVVESGTRLAKMAARQIAT